MASPFSVSESLALGLTHRMTDEYSLLEKQHLDENKKKFPRGIPPLPAKRALAYRILKERTKKLIPPSQYVSEGLIGTQSGESKQDSFVFTHWKTTADANRLDLLVTYCNPKLRLPRRWSLCEVSNHALRRLFFRLKTLDHRVVLEEMKMVASALCRWYGPLINVCVNMRESDSIIIPTATGAMFFNRNKETAPHAPVSMIASTWISDQRITDEYKLQMIIDARNQQSFLLLENNGLIKPLLFSSNEKSQHVSTQNFHYFQEMLSHLSAYEIEDPAPSAKSKRSLRI